MVCSSVSYRNFNSSNWKDLHCQNLTCLNTSELLPCSEPVVNCSNWRVQNTHAEHNLSHLIYMNSVPLLCLIWVYSPIVRSSYPARFGSSPRWKAAISCTHCDLQYSAWATTSTHTRTHRNRTGQAHCLSRDCMRYVQSVAKWKIILIHSMRIHKLNSTAQRQIQQRA